MSWNAEYGRMFRRKHPLYRTWEGIKYRCMKPSCKMYPNYGGRGIKMHDPWHASFPAFEFWILENLGPRPEGASLDRIDNDGNYEPGNLRWATSMQQAQNRRSSLRRALPRNVYVDPAGLRVEVRGFPDLESARRVAEYALSVRDEALKTTSNTEAA